MKIEFNMSAFCVFVILCFLSKISAQPNQRSSCPKIDGLPRFDVSEFSGRWYVAREHPERTGYAGLCLAKSFIPFKNNSISLVTTGIEPRSREEIDEIQQIGHWSDPSEPAKLTIELLALGFSYTPKNDFWILGTDYDSYLILYNCKNYKFRHITATIYTREQKAPDSVINEAIEVVEKLTGKLRWEDNLKYCPSF